MKAAAYAGLVAVCIVAAAAAVVLAVYAAPAATLTRLSWVPRFGRTLSLKELGGARLLLEVDAPTSQPGALQAAVQQTVTAIGRRLADVGANDGRVVQTAMNRIVVEVPGASNLAGLKTLATSPGNLTFQLVDDQVAANAASWQIPPDDVVLREVAGGSALVLKALPFAEGDMLTDARQGFDANGRPAITLSFDARGAQGFADTTRLNPGRRFAVVFDGLVLAAPTIEGPITDGHAEITGAYTIKSAEDLATLLRSGSLPDGVRVIAAELVQPGG